MTDIEILKEGIKALDSKKADDIRILKVRDLTILANYFVIVSGSSSTQVKALADEVDFKLGEKGEEPKSIDGKASGNWIVLDYIDVVSTFSIRKRGISTTLKGSGRTLRKLM